MNESNILKNFGVPVAYEDAHFVASIDEVLIEMYEQAYERMCLEDHAKAERCNSQSLKFAEEIAEKAYKIAWNVTGNEELCSLVSDDLRTLVAIASEAAEDLNQFQRQRIAWYERGHFPCGYHGTFPNGKWVIA
ncbi:MAG: hypothetical protein Q7T36_15875 [Fluviicoccus sp.]|uniref:hypothetical protein n=1 Tax=Fluviicoccus sp. TaxID=2003552 RepID=UPI0027291E3B|nr:hypothetical protein [Fluviicoccus sp.]MDO8331944.1 hypothetical protein [Fluviicoccus sp.]